jgi:adenylate cyclase
MNPGPEPKRLDDLVDWMVRFGVAHDDLGALLAGVCERLVAAGIPVWRGSLDIPTIDPSSRAMAHKWWRDRPLSVEALPHGPQQEGVFRQSVIYHVLSRGLDACRWRIEHGEGLADFGLLRTLSAEGGTDYLLRVVGFGQGATALMGVAVSLATQRPGGFTNEEIAAVERLAPALGLAAYRISLALTARESLSIYLGANTARRVLAGEIRRGEGDTISAAILFADLKQFTAFTERQDALRVVGWLNEHFEAIGVAVAAHGGEILKFMGDGLLAVFPVADTGARPCPVCDTALGAAADAHAANCALNERRAAQGEPTLDVDVALHFGEVVYGNVGASRRLDFTVIGRAVNETCRMERLCDEIGRNLVLSQAFAERCATPTVEVGAFPLRGIEGSRVVYGLA